MNIPPRIIELAIQGGYEPSRRDIDLITGHDPQYHYDTSCRLILDPLFFQAIGKACGWDEDKNKHTNRGWTYEWLYKAERCLRLILTSSDLSPFWESIKPIV